MGRARLDAEKHNMLKNITRAERRVVRLLADKDGRRLEIVEMNQDAKPEYRNNVVGLSLAELRRIVRTAEKWAARSAKQPAKRAAKQATGRDSNS